MQFLHDLIVLHFRPRETNKFNIKVNVEALQSVVFNLTYKEILRRKTGKYCHVIYIDPGQTVEDFQIEVAIQESRDITSLNVPPIRDDLLTNVIISDSGIVDITCVLFSFVVYFVVPGSKFLCFCYLHVQYRHFENLKLN